ncbi:EcoAI/FtnUII family type I restriction enzme subunit R [Photobacterium sanguinicancri]|uniref:DEAD/DEAH box helicase family protein n=1 Tax=Photobacterium sanguinicancri TaxID=875932 RepID=A0AAW7Y465_9GAMM|nr:type I restriction endonuclease subunit R [Photobacterium sanguinicancri]MDO6542561.1 DEAD/DEAH box helicase family protein [Photobacterium sanguinicancri]
MTSQRTEADTRADLIDPMLVKCGWGGTEHSYIRREVICPGRIMNGGKRGTKVSSDYVLEYKGKKLGVVEAKKESLSYSEGVRQAIDYATRLQCRVAYATNGHEIYEIDMVTGDQKLVDRYLSPDELWALTFTDSGCAAEWRQRFADVPFETKGGSWTARYYQENAINNALEAIAKGDDRILLTLATGTGKTFIAFQLAWKLFYSRWSKASQSDISKATRRPRILFLADRNILADQAFNSFSPFSEDAIIRIEPKEVKKAGRVPKNGSIFFTIFQTFMSGKDENGEDAPYFGEYPADFFDFIMIDECHRGGAKDESSWRGVLEYFESAVQLGLTATPKRKDNTDTYKYFGEPVYSYTLKEGINDGFLTPFKVLPIVGTMDEYIYTKGDGVIVDGEPEEGRVYKEGDFNRIITIPAREKKRVHYWMDKFNPKEKTIVFCATQEHAGMVRDFINEYAVSKNWTRNPSYCVRVTADDGKAGETDLKVFQDNEKTIPTILTTSRKLSTGVDARNVRNIVLMRECKNMIEFKQIVGRGTRVFDGKDYFTIYDFVKAYHNFADPEWDGEPLEPEEPKPRGGGKPCDKCGQQPCACEATEPKPCKECGALPCICEKKKKVKIKLSDGKERSIKHISSVMYWHGDKPITAHEFMQLMFDDLPKFFENEDKLREIWSDATTREQLLLNLAEHGYDAEKLGAMKELIDAENSDVYDVLAYVAYAAETKSRATRVADARTTIDTAFTDNNQQDFIHFILGKYVEDGEGELLPKKMPSLLTLKYKTPKDAVDLFGSPAVIRETFLGFQKHLYS